LAEDSSSPQGMEALWGTGPGAAGGGSDGAREWAAARDRDAMGDGGGGVAEWAGRTEAESGIFL
jgi:hypothetical protein